MGPFSCRCDEYVLTPGTHRRHCVFATAEDKARADAFDLKRLEQHHRGVIDGLNREAQRPDKAVPRRNMRW